MLTFTCCGSVHISDSTSRRHRSKSPKPLGASVSAFSSSSASASCPRSQLSGLHLRSLTETAWYVSDFPRLFQTRVTYLLAIFVQLRPISTPHFLKLTRGIRRPVAYSFGLRMDSAAYLLLALVSAGTLLQGKPSYFM